MTVASLSVLVRNPAKTNWDSVPYGDFVERLFKVEAYKDMLHHAKGGVCEEAGELSSALKIYLTYGKALDSETKEGQTLYENIVEEMGDLMFYLVAIQGLLGISMEEVLQHNAHKLSARYQNLTYSDQAAQNRADKVKET